LRNSALEAVYEKDGLAKNYDFVSILSLSENEPLRDKIKLLTEPAWFTEENMTESEKPLPVFIPDKMAEFLGIYPSAVDREDIEIRINGRACLVKGIFDSLALEQLRDLDGTSLLPFDLEAMTSFELQGNMVLADPDDPRLPAGQIVICPARDLGILADNAEGARLVSVAIHMPDLGYKDAKEEIDMFLEQNGRATYYGLDGVAYLGKRARERSVAGLIELLIPLLIAALTVLNTMKGSVYERTDEIFVYNAVGIAPRYVFFMFFAEAFVYAVVGSVLGYLLSQGSGRILTALDMTGGLNMTYASITTIYASLSIAAAVFISTYFPAKSAMEIATPAEDAGWGLPEPDGDDLNFDLPFSCDKHDRVAIMSFFDRYLRDHGEGSAGRFFAGLPSAGVSSGTAGSDTGGYIPQISSAIWLKPFDLGVSQEMTISMPFDTETGEYKARIQLRRLSGKRDSWLRLNYSFVSLIRRHFLHWRAVRTPEREEMFREARKLLIENCGAQ
jgi:hypothetical protein